MTDEKPMTDELEQFINGRQFWEHRILDTLNAMTDKQLLDLRMDFDTPGAMFVLKLERDPARPEVTSCTANVDGPKPAHADTEGAA
jgi:hypothetical protein